MIENVKKLVAEMQHDFGAQLRKNAVINGLYKKVKDGNASYAEAHKFSVEASRILSEIFKDKLAGHIDPEEQLYYDMAKQIIEPLMVKDFELISGISMQVQSNLNKQAQLGIKAIGPELNQDRIDGIAKKLSGDKYKNTKWILGEAVVNFGQSIVDDTIKANAEFHFNSGLQPVIVRKEMGNCCDWCRGLAGRYIYPDVPKDVYRRHRFCRCTTDYHPGNGKKQNVHTKKWSNEAVVEKRKQVGITNYKGENVSARYFGTAAPGKGIITLEPGISKKTHADEINMANFLHALFGGNITILKEANLQGVKTADFLWNDKLWDLKSVTSEKAADSAIRKGLKQIKDNPGGIILDYRKQNVSLDKILPVVDGRMKRGIERDTDIMIVLNEKRVVVMRYKK